MADLGTVVGVVSLSLQVFEYVHTYVDALQGRKEDLASTIRHCDTLQRLLEQTKTLQEKHHTSLNVSSIAVKQAMSATAAEMTLLRELIAKIAPDHPQPKSIAGRLDKQKQRMLYPFRRSNLEQLDERLARANEALHSTLQLAVLETTTETSHILRDVQTDLGSSHTEMKNKLDTLQNISQQGHNAISAAYQETSLTRAELRLFIPQSTTQAQISLEKIQNIERHVDGSSPLIFETHQNTLALRKTADELTTMLKDLRSPTAGIFCQKLISKPSTLKLICDQEQLVSESGQSADQFSEINLGDTYSSLFSCSCHRRRRLHRKRYQFGRAFLAQEIFTDNAHSPGCPFSDLAKPQIRRSIRVSMTMFRAALSAALTLTMNSPSGAGGFGICPSFTYYPVNPYSPVTYALCILWYCFYDMCGHEYHRIVKKCLEVLRWAFKTGRASPFDRTADGSTLLHLLLDSAFIVLDQPQYLETVLVVAKFLATVGVPRDKENDRTWLPWHMIVMLTEKYDYWSLESMPQLLGICWIDDPSTALDLPFGRANNGYSPISVSSQQVLYHSLNDQAEWLGNDLQLAIFRKDTNRLLEILKSCPPSEELYTQDAFGTTALQMAVSWPQGLRIILDRIDNSVLEDHDKANAPLIQYAMGCSRHNCSKDYTLRCADSCSCVDAVALLLEAKCPMLFGHSGSDRFYSATTRCKELFTTHLKKRRQELAKLALINLHPRDVSRFNLTSPSVLDHYTPDVIGALGRQGVHIPRWLHTESLSPCCSTSTPTCTQSIYHTLAQAPFEVMDPIATLDRFYAAGFIDVDAASSCCGRTPVMLMRVGRPDVFVWFLQHGIDLLTQVLPTNKLATGWLVVHQIFISHIIRLNNMNLEQQQQQQQKQLHQQLRQQLQQQQQKQQQQQQNQQEYIMQLTGKLHGHPCNDGCICGCSTNGCHPWTTFWKICYDGTRSHESRRVRFDCLKKRRDEFLKASENAPDVLAEVKAISLRTSTFAALPIRHTCCDMNGHTMNEDEVEEIRQEDAVELELLEKLLVEFEEELERQGCSLGQFFRTYWDDRMEQVLHEIDEKTITRENLAGAAELGVRLGCDKAGPVSRWGTQYWKEPDFWMERLDKLME